MTFGGIDPSDEGRPIFYEPLAEETYYVVGLEDMLVGNHSFMPQTEVDGITIVDSGTTDIIIPSTMFQSLSAIFQQHYCNLTGICGTFSIFQHRYCIYSSPVCSLELKHSSC